MRLSAVFLLATVLAAPVSAQTAPAAPAVEQPAPTRVSAVAPAADPQNVWLLDLSDGGRVTIQLRPDAAPLMVERVKTLTRQHFYDGLTFHRVIDGFMAQGGDPKGDGTGGSSLPDIKAEFNSLPHVRGAVAAARAEKPDSANSQFYIVFQPRFALDQKYTVFGRVLDGMAYVDAVARGEPPANPTRIVHAYIASDNPPPYQAAPPLPASAAPATLPGTVSRKPPVVPSQPQGSSAKR
jgi:cyclophilin family peptidyl-prolyl cis-trans isomerase